MNSRKLLFILFSIIFLLFASSCEKKIEKIEEKTRKEVEGLWKRIDVSNVSSDTYDEWRFTNGKFDVVRCHIATNQRDSIVTGDYVISANLTKKNITITNCSDSHINDKWRIHILKDDYFSFYRRFGGLEYLEFTRQ